MKSPRLLAVLLAAVLLAAWELACRLMHVPPLVLPAPSGIAQALWKGLASGFFWPHVATTAGELLLGLVAGCTTVGAATAAFTQSFAPGSGARIHIVTDGSHEWAVLAAHADKATNGEVVVLDLTPADAVTPPAQVGSTLSVDGLLSSTIGVFDSKTYVVLGEAPLGRAGTDVVVGYVETHGRALTAALLEELEVMPRRMITRPR